MKLRNWVLMLHGSIGMVLGLLLITISLSGASIVFHQELDHALNRSLYQVTPQAEQVSLDAVVAPVLAAHHDLPVWFIEVPKAPDQSYVINQKMANKHRLQTFVNPYTGGIIGSRIWEFSVVGFLYTIHHDLFVGKVGQIVVGITGLLLLLMAISGVFLWTGWRKLITGFKIRWKAPPSLFSYDIHNVVGIVSSLFLAITAVTGVVIVVLHFLPVFSPTVETKTISPQKPVSLGELVRQADAAIPEGKTTQIEFPKHSSRILTFRKQLPNQETGHFDLSTVELDRDSGAVVQTTKVVKAEGLFKFIVTIADLHFGTFGGLPTRILYVFFGLMPTVLFVTGLVNWRRRRVLGDRRKTAFQLAQETQETTQTKR